MPKKIPLSPQMWDFFEGVINITIYTLSAMALSGYGIDHHFFQILISTNLPGLSLLALAVLREKHENRRWQLWQVI